MIQKQVGMGFQKTLEGGVNPWAACEDSRRSSEIKGVLASFERIFMFHK